MTIAAHIEPASLYDNGLLTECLQRLAAQNPEHHFIFFIEEPVNIPLTANCTIVTINPVIKNRLLLHYWYQLKLPGLLKRYGADVFLSARGLTQFSAVHQLLVIRDNSLWEQTKSPAFHHQYLKMFLKTFLKKSAAIIIGEETVKQHLKIYSGINVRPVSFGLNPLFRPYSWQEKEVICEQYSSGNEFFIFHLNQSAKQDAIQVLKAFSIFKKWQKSSLKLVITGSDPLPELDTYKLRDQVIKLNDLNIETIASLTASAFGMIDMSNGTFGLNALQAGVPLITLDTLPQRNLYGDAAVYAMLHHKELSEKMMMLYKDESAKEERIRNGIALAANYSWENSAALLWNTILHVTEQPKS